MNEQIKKLVDAEMEANYWPKKGKDSKYYGPEATAKSLEKYTKSIIEKCISEFNKHSTVDYAIIKVKEHFGIEK